MRVYSDYRTVVLQLYPLDWQVEVLRRLEESVFKIIGMGRLKLQSLLYDSFKDSGISSRTLGLLVQRFTGSLGNKAVIPFDEDNSRFIFDRGMWFFEFQAKRGRGRRMKIMTSKSERKYYDVIEHLKGYPCIMTRENDKYFLYVSIPVKQNADSNLTVGVDVNMYKWVASPPRGKPVFFPVKEYSEKADRIQRLISRFQSRGKPVSHLYRQRESLLKNLHGNFLKKIIETYNHPTLAFEQIDTLYKLTEKRSKMINIWLYSKTALRKLILRAMAKGLKVIEVNPKNTSTTCHRCQHHPITIYGKHKRLIKCPNCKLKDFNRDLNAARNIAIKAATPTPQNDIQPLNTS